MFQLITYLVGIACILISANYAQTDPTLCPNGPTQIQDPKWRTIPPRFEIMTELISGTDIIELSQAFSATRDAVVFESSAGSLAFNIIFS